MEMCVSKFLVRCACEEGPPGDEKNEEEEEGGVQMCIERRCMSFLCMLHIDGEKI